MADKKKQKTPDEDFDFFAPHPHPTTVRVKNSFFDMVPDAYGGKSIAFSEEVKKKKEKEMKELKAKEEAAKKEEEEKKAEPEPEPVQEKLKPQTVFTQEANPWDQTDEVRHGIVWQHVVQIS